MSESDLRAAASGVLPLLFTTDELRGEIQCIGCSKTTRFGHTPKHYGGCKVKAFALELHQEVVA